MNKALLVLLLALAVSACQQPVSQSVAARPDPVANTAPDRGPALFELRDFSVEKEGRSYGGASYTGRGTLVSRDPRLSDGAFFVFLSAKQEHEADGSFETQVLLKDGIGQVRVGTYQTEQEEKTEKVRYYDWSVVGYIELSQGTFKASELEISPSS